MNHLQYRHGSSEMSEAEQAQDTPSPAPVKPASGGRTLATIAALLALAAIGAAGYVWTEVQKLQSLPQQMRADSGKTEQLRSELVQRLDTLSMRLDEEATAAAELQAVVAAEVAAVAELSVQIGQIGEQVDSLTGTDRSQRNRFLRAEALYYLRLANARALLASDARVAAQALQLADDKLRETGDPKLNAVRARLAEELAALRAIPEIDVTGIAFRLQSLAEQTASWPLRNAAPAGFNSELPGIAGSDESGATDAWSRFKATVSGVFKSIVNVRENAERPEVQLSNTQEALVIESLRAELQLARLAFVAGDFPLFEQSLAGVEKTVRAYFDTDNAAVGAALQTLAEIAAIERPPEMPDISTSLSLLLGGDVDTGATGAQ